MPADSDIQQSEAVAAFAKQAADVLPASRAQLTETVHVQKQTNVTARVRKYCAEGWPGYTPQN